MDVLYKASVHQVGHCLSLYIQRFKHNSPSKSTRIYMPHIRTDLTEVQFDLNDKLTFLYELLYDLKVSIIGSLKSAFI